MCRKIYMQGIGPGEGRVERPWGWYEVLATGDGYQVKRILVKPGQRLSYQSHTQRSERWTVASGTAAAILDGEKKFYNVGDVIYVPLGTKHRLINPGTTDLIVIEVQLGVYLGEDDITRYEDDYGRTEQVS